MNRRVLVALLLAATPFVALAAPPPAPNPLPSTLPQGPTSVLCLIESTTNWLFTIFLVTAVVFIVLAAYKYLFSGGGEQAGAAHKMLIYAAVAVAVAMFSRGFVFVVGQLVGAPGVDVSCSTISRTSGTRQTGSTTNTPAPTAGFYKSVGPLGSGVSVEVCSDGQTPGVIIDNQKYGDNPNITASAAHPTAGFYRSLTTGGSPSVSVQICSDGTTPHAIINNVRYPN